MKSRSHYSIFLSALAISVSAGCTSPSIPNPTGVATISFNPAVPGPVHGVGIESQDIISMSDRMMRDMLSVERLTRTSEDAKRPRVIIDDKYFANDSSQPINRSLITDRLRVSLNRAAKGRMVFVGRAYASMVADERSLKRNGKTDVGTTGLTKAQMGADYRLGGRIATSDQRSSASGLVQRYTQVTFEMVDLETSEIAWSGIYEFLRSAADDVMYR